ncbi:hypothetical protein [Hyphomonas sp.]|uniref:hypothetical protein n=1 Tax=Hyphomonas sp. TaxID=87 RepID=UPI00391A9226
MRTTVRLDEALLRAAKIKAAKEGRTLTSLIEEGLRRVIEGERAAGRGAGLREEAAAFDADARLDSALEFVRNLPKVSGPSLFDHPEYRRLAAKAGSDLPSHVLAVMDEEEDLDRLLRPDSSAPDPSASE